MSTTINTDDITEIVEEFYGVKLVQDNTYHQLPTNIVFDMIHQYGKYLDTFDMSGCVSAAIMHVGIKDKPENDDVLWNTILYHFELSVYEKLGVPEDMAELRTALMAHHEDITKKITTVVKNIVLYQLTDYTY